MLQLLCTGQGHVNLMRRARKQHNTTSLYICVTVERAIIRLMMSATFLSNVEVQRLNAHDVWEKQSRAAAAAAAEHESSPLFQDEIHSPFMS